MAARAQAGRIGFLLAVSPWAAAGIGLVLRLGNDPRFGDMVSLLIMCAPVALLASYAGLIFDRPKGWAIAGTAIAFVNRLLTRGVSATP